MPEQDFDELAWRERIEEYRAEKDEFLAEHPQSPIPPEERDDFDGLDYYAPDPKYRVVARIQEPSEIEEVELETTSGPDRTYERVATLGFTLEDEHHVLEAYAAPSQEGLFVPFSDATSGEETYGKGRYLELDVETFETGDDVVVDFNIAYSPFCAYNEGFACVIPPEKNHVSVSVRAGERAP
ncbi:DUF1684 domain-containing protein [Halarchaeum sp. CBA1220]|uniref:DUF1684 domain-containing protein n=1 Tax=Halarchaeum sp. CBA1220 TaxID=1853682 RepID=UPI000F3A81C6|nr:DUF1684 domain-containing protein [Halarchaeum sp. CBA1220]QLC33967.1 DUF1684 domain-containing protein [Halarchaeum sp. CBA1220]